MVELPQNFRDETWLFSHLERIFETRHDRLLTSHDRLLTLTIYDRLLTRHDRLLTRNDRLLNFSFCTHFSFLIYISIQAHRSYGQLLLTPLKYLPNTISTLHKGNSSGILHLANKEPLVKQRSHIQLEISVTSSNGQKSKQTKKLFAIQEWNLCQTEQQIPAQPTPGRQSGLCPNNFCFQYQGTNPESLVQSKILLYLVLYAQWSDALQEDFPEIV